MKTLIIEKLARIIKNKKKLEESLKIKITNRGKEVTIRGDPENETQATRVIEALNFGFPYIEAMRIIEEDLLFETVNIKDYTNKANLERIRGRVIGQGGKTLKVLSDLTGCGLELKENKVGIVGEAENLKRASEALISIIKGSKQGAVYKELENNMPHPIDDLGLKDQPMKTMEEYEKDLKKHSDSE